MYQDDHAKLFLPDFHVFYEFHFLTYSFSHKVIMYRVINFI